MYLYTIEGTLDYWIPLKHETIEFLASLIDIAWIRIIKRSNLNFIHLLKIDSHLSSQSYKDSRNPNSNLKFTNKLYEIY